MDDQPMRDEDSPDGTDDEKGTKSLTRRRFLDYVVGGSIAATIGGSAVVGVSFLYAPESAQEAESVEIGPLDDFLPGTGKVVNVGNTNVIVVRPGPEEEMVAFSALCTHLGCVVVWDQELAQITCPCHGAKFDLKGNVVSGPAPRPLPPFPVSVQGGNVTVGSA